MALYESLFINHVNPHHFLLLSSNCKNPYLHHLAIDAKRLVTELTQQQLVQAETTCYDKSDINYFVFQSIVAWFLFQR